MSDVKNIGILGGTFDPIHNGHIAMAKYCYEQFGFDELWLLVSGMPYLKEGKNVTDSLHRINMVKLVCDNHPGFIMKDDECRRSGNTYTYETLEQFKKEYPDYNFSFIIGEDSFDYFDKWLYPERILECADLIVLSRGSSTNNTELKPLSNNKIEQLELHAKELCNIFKISSHKIKITSVEPPNISSTMVRELFHNNKISANYSDLLPEYIIEYITKNRLYV